MPTIRDVGRSPDLSVVREAKQDPVTFARLLLGQNPWRVQQEILTSAARNPLTAVKSCHASGKTYNAAAVALWALSRSPESLVITTAPTFRQVKVLWGEIAEARKRSRIAFPGPSATELKLGDKRFPQFVTKRAANQFSGLESG